MSPSKPEMPQGPRITFGMIVLNGEPFLRYNLRSLYPYAHQIIVAEGAAPGARNIATPQGHSRDGTLEVLRRSEEHTSELQSLMRTSYAVFCLKKKNETYIKTERHTTTTNT